MTIKEKRIKIYKKYDGHCSYCGKDITFKEMQVDHMNPKCLQGLNKALFEGVVIDNTDHIDNLVPCCRMCNHYKRASSVEQFRRSMKTLHERLEAYYINKVAVDFGMMEIKPFDGLFYFEKLTNQ